MVVKTKYEPKQKVLYKKGIEQLIGTISGIRTITEPDGKTKIGYDLYNIERFSPLTINEEDIIHEL